MFRLARTLSSALWLVPSLVSAQTALPARAALFAADRRVAEASFKGGLRQSLGEAFLENGVYLYPGAPVVEGAAKIKALLTAQPLLDSLTVQWHPLDGFVSRDSSLGVTYGVLAVTAKNGMFAGARLGKYIAAWRMDAGTWRLAALVQIGLAPPGRAVVRSELGPVERPALLASGSPKDFIQADMDFAALARKSGAAVAFRTFAAPEAVTLPGTGELTRGPEAIGKAFAGDQSDWTWSPVAAGSATGRDLGFTVGQAVIRPKSGEEAAYTKYLSIWRRLPNGQVRFLTDGGNARPKP
ncbi:MAG: hypothetical protein ABI647_04220 [Gemmatimonadota bacterium]